MKLISEDSDGDRKYSADVFVRFTSDLRKNQKIVTVSNMDSLTALNINSKWDEAAEVRLKVAERSLIDRRVQILARLNEQGGSFSLQTLFLSSDGSCFGIGGHCSWDEEHGWGMIIKDGAVLNFGEQSNAFHPSRYIEQKVTDPFEKYKDDMRYSLEAKGVHLNWLVKITRSQKTLIERYIQDSQAIGVPGLMALFILEIVSAAIDEELDYTLDDFKKSYKCKINLSQTLVNLALYNKAVRSYARKASNASFRGVSPKVKIKYKTRLPVYNNDLSISNPQGNLCFHNMMIQGKKYTPAIIGA